MQVALTEFAEENIQADDTDDEMIDKLLARYKYANVSKDQGLEILAKSLDITPEDFMLYLRGVRHQKLRNVSLQKQKEMNRKKNKAARKARRENRK